MPQDFGPLYIETDMSRFPVEPWNTYSNLIFLFVCCYWAYRTKMNFRRHPLLTIGLPILLVGYVGGTFYHATRSLRLWLLMDFIPIAILCLMVSYAYWLKLLHRHLLVVVCVLVPFVGIRVLLLQLVAQRLAINVSYVTLVLLFLIPTYIYAFSRRVKKRGQLILATLAFAVAIACRVLDDPQSLVVQSYFPMGTHWLWHLFGGLATYFLISFLYEDIELNGDASKISN